MPKITGLGHIVIYVSDLAISRDWYIKNLKLTEVISSPERKGCFLSFGERDHDIALFENSAATSIKTIHHVALAFDGSNEDFFEFCRNLKNNEVEIERIVDHGISYGIYFFDPDKHCWEVFIEQERPEQNRIEAIRSTGILSKPIDINKPIS